MLKPAAAGGLLCFGPDRDRNVTFTDPRSHPLRVKWGDIVRADRGRPVATTPSRE
jgi:hypothetical protein